MQSCCAPLYPLDAPYTDPPARDLLAFSRQHIAGAREADDHGRCPRAYPGGRLGDYPMRPDLPAINAMFARLGCDPAQGDAVVVIGTLR